MKNRRKGFITIAGCVSRKYYEEHGTGGYEKEFLHSCGGRQMNVQVMLYTDMLIYFRLHNVRSPGN